MGIKTTYSKNGFPLTGYAKITGVNLQYRDGGFEGQIQLGLWKDREASKPPVPIPAVEGGNPPPGPIFYVSPVEQMSVPVSVSGGTITVADLYAAAKKYEQFTETTDVFEK